MGGEPSIGVLVSGGCPGTLAAMITVEVVAVGGWPGRCVITVLSWACTMTLCREGGEEEDGIPAEAGKGERERERGNQQEASNSVIECQLEGI